MRQTYMYIAPDSVVSSTGQESFGRTSRWGRPTSGHAAIPVQPRIPRSERFVRRGLELQPSALRQLEHSSSGRPPAESAICKQAISKPTVRASSAELRMLVFCSWTVRRDGACLRACAGMAKKIQGEQKYCVVRESNPGLPRGRREFYH